MYCPARHSLCPACKQKIKYKYYLAERQSADLFVVCSCVALVLFCYSFDHKSVYKDLSTCIFKMYVLFLIWIFNFIHMCLVCDTCEVFFKFCSCWLLTGFLLALIIRSCSVWICKKARLRLCIEGFGCIVIKLSKSVWKCTKIQNFRHK